MFEEEEVVEAKVALQTTLSIPIPCELEPVVFNTHFR
mgnify:CR=1 FL=1